MWPFCTISLVTRQCKVLGSIVTSGLVICRLAHIEEQAATSLFPIPMGWAQWPCWAWTLFSPKLSFHIHCQILAVPEKENKQMWWLVKNRSNVIQLCFEDFMYVPFATTKKETRQDALKMQPIFVCLLPNPNPNPNPSPLSLSLFLLIIKILFPYPKTQVCPTLSRFRWNCHTETAINASPSQMGALRVGFTCLPMPSHWSVIHWFCSFILFVVSSTILCYTISDLPFSLLMYVDAFSFFESKIYAAIILVYNNI